MRLFLVEPAELPDAWSAVSPLVGRICDSSHGKFEPADIIKMLVGGDFQLWVLVDDDGAPQVVYLGRIVIFPRRRVYEPLAVASTDMPEYLDSWLESFEQIEKWAKDRGCDMVQSLARPGFERSLRKRGYKRSHVLLEKEL